MAKEVALVDGTNSNPDGWRSLAPHIRDSNPCKVADVGVMALAQGCPGLQKIDLSGCGHVSNADVLMPRALASSPPTLVEPHDFLYRLPFNDLPRIGGCAQYPRGPSLELGVTGTLFDDCSRDSCTDDVSQSATEADVEIDSTCPIGNLAWTCMPLWGQT